MAALEKTKADKEAHGEFDSACPGYCGAQDTFYVGTLKGVGRIYQQTFIDTYAKVGFAKLYDLKTAITAADLLNDRVLPFYDEHDIPLCRVLTDRGSEYCGNPERHEYELYLAIEDIDHTRTKTKSPQTNGICERFHKTMLDEFYRVAFRKKLYRSIAELQADLDEWLRQYNEVRTHQGRWCYGKTPMQTFLDAQSFRVAGGAAKRLDLAYRTFLKAVRAVATGLPQSVGAMLPFACLLSPCSPPEPSSPFDVVCCRRMAAFSCCAVEQRPAHHRSACGLRGRPARART